MTFTGRRDHGRGHTYYLDGQKIPGVTTIIRAGLPAPALIDWAARSAAELAVDRWDELSDLPPSERLALIGGAPDAVRDAAGVQGTRVHSLARRLAAGEEVPVPDQLAGYVESCVKFLNDWDARPLLTEVPVISRQWKYGGTLDMIADLADGKRWLLDWKTARNTPFGKTGFQLAGYRYADFYLDAGGAEHPVPPVDECGVVWLRADGYDLYPYHADASVHRQFLYIQQCAVAVEECRDYRGDALLPPGGSHP